MLYKVPSSTVPAERLHLLSTIVERTRRDPRVRQWALNACDHVDDPMRCAQAILWHVQSRPYTLPNRSGEWVQFDLGETIDFGGDCKALAQLVCACAAVHAIPYQLVWRSSRGRDREHCYPRLCIAGEWLAADPSVRGAALGEDPAAAAKRLGGALGKRSTAEYDALAKSLSPR